MGTDIHGVFQKREGDSWVDVPAEFEENRHYLLFAVLANVRNGFGFGGLESGECLHPIAFPRRLPAEFDGEPYHFTALSNRPKWVREYRTKDHTEEEESVLLDTEEELWLGDHSYSWLTSTEMLAWYDIAPTTIRTGIIPIERYREWDKVSSPSSYSLGISGPDVVIAAEVELGKIDDSKVTYVQVTWEVSLQKELAYFFDEIRRLHNEHGEIRYVFGFDS